MSDNTLKDASGIPVPDNQNSITAGHNGPIVINDFQLIEKLAHFNRERIPERVVHAKGAGAYGYFEVTHPVSQWTKAQFLSEVGKRTEIFTRFSTVGGEKGSADTARDPRGFAVKFYTEEGNYDIVGNNTPVFFIRDPMKFPDLIHSQKRNPGSNLKDPDAFWDFFSLSPESIHQVTILFSDRGTPKSFRHMHGFSSHTFKWVNAQGESFWVKYHFKTAQGIQNFTAEEAERLAGEDPDHAIRDLYDSIARGEEAVWQVYVQVMPQAEAASYRYDAFDLTKVWPFADYPLQPVGRMVLNRNPRNFFAETEQAAFTPANLVPGIEPSPDRMLQGRLFAYGDAHRYRVGPNHQMLPVNYPKNSQPYNYQRDGAMRFDQNGNESPNYEPNSANGPQQAPEYGQRAYPVEGLVERTGFSHPNSDFEQAGALYRKVMNEEERTRLINNIVGHMRHVTRPEIQHRQIWHFYRADAEYGMRIAAGLGLDINEIITKTGGVLNKV